VLPAGLSVVVLGWERIGELEGVLERGEKTEK